MSTENWEKNTTMPPWTYNDELRFLKTQFGYREGRNMKFSNFYEEKGFEYLEKENAFARKGYS